MLKREVLEFQATPSTRSVNDGSRLHFSSKSKQSQQKERKREREKERRDESKRENLPLDLSSNARRVLTFLLVSFALFWSDGLLLGDNPWICSCNLLWLSEWLRRWAKETRKAYAFNVDMDPSHWSSLFDVTCTTADQDAQRARLIEFQRDIRISCPSLYSSSPSSTYVFSSSSSPSLSPSLLLLSPLWTKAFVTWPAPSVTGTLSPPLLSLILATFVTYVSSTVSSLACQV